MSCNCSPVSNDSGCGCNDSKMSDIACPMCAEKGKRISEITLKSQVDKHLFDSIDGDINSFNFCTNPSCSNVYYDNTQKLTFSLEDIKSKVTIKDNHLDTPLCYCKKLLKRDFYELVEKKDPNIAKKIKEIIASGKTFCEKSNPKGVCCTEDVDSFFQAHGIVYKSDNLNSESCC